MHIVIASTRICRNNITSLPSASTQFSQGEDPRKRSKDPLLSAKASHGFPTFPTCRSTLTHALAHVARTRLNQPTEATPNRSSGDWRRSSIQPAELFAHHRARYARLPAALNPHAPAGAHKMRTSGSGPFAPAYDVLSLRAPFSRGVRNHGCLSSRVSLCWPQADLVAEDRDGDCDWDGSRNT